MAASGASESNGILHVGGALEQMTPLTPLQRPTPDAKLSPQPYRHRLMWRKIIIMSLLHAGALYGAFLMVASAKVITTIYAIFLCQATLLGGVAGAHRLWSHRSYKAKWPLRVFLMLLQTASYQSHIYEWVRDHRMHHKYSETDSDPHNAKRGFFFAHIGWAMVRKHPEVKAKGHTLDLSDLKADPIVVFQKKYYYTLLFIVTFISTAIPVYFWDESFMNAWFVATNLRNVIATNVALLINSATHCSGQWGSKPYDRHINTTDHLGVSLAILGEGYHNYHHVFPWDYKGSEMNNYSINTATAFIDFCSLLGLAHDLKTVPTSIVEKRVKRTGDGSHKMWGRECKNISPETVAIAKIINGKTR